MTRLQCYLNIPKYINSSYKISYILLLIKQMGMFKNQMEDIIISYIGHQLTTLFSDFLWFVDTYDDWLDLDQGLKTGIIIQQLYHVIPMGMGPMIMQFFEP